MSKHGWRARLPKLIAGGVLLLVMAALIYVIKGFIDSAAKPAKNRVQKISLVKPPEPKPPEVKPPEPEKQEIKKEVVLDQPAPAPETPNEPPPDMGSTLGPGNDGFGLAKGTGSGRIGGTGNRARWYAGLLGTRIEQALNHDATLLDELKAKRIVVRIWVGDSGHVERVEWDKGAVAANFEQALREQLLELTVQESPDGIEQPIWYRFRPRG